MTRRFPTWMIIVLLLQLLLAGLFFLFAYSLSWSLAQGRTPATGEIVTLAAPLVGVAMAGVAAWGAWRSGLESLSSVLAVLPLPLFLALFLALGAF